MNTLIRYCLVVQVTLVAVALSAIIALLMVINVNVGFIALGESIHVGEGLMVGGTLLLVSAGGIVLSLAVWSQWNRARLFLLTL